MTEEKRYERNIKQRLKARYKRDKQKQFNNFKMLFKNARKKILDLN